MNLSKVYHCTSKKNLISILSEGLLPSNKYGIEDYLDDEGNLSDLSEDEKEEYDAIAPYVFASRDEDNLWNTDEGFIVLEIDASHYTWIIDPIMLEQCEEFWDNEDNSWIDESDYKKHWSVATESKIDPKHITLCT